MKVGFTARWTSISVANDRFRQARSTRTGAVGATDAVRPLGAIRRTTAEAVFDQAE